ncbi:MAG: flagellin [Pseudomonadota bacterium]
MGSINFNQSAQVALMTLNMVNKNLFEVQDQISTGKQISSAKDNAAVWAISTIMESDVMGFKQINDSLTLGSSTVEVARAATEEVTTLLQEIKAKVVAAQESNVDRTSIQRDVDALRDQIDTIVDAAQFNGLNLLRGGEEISILSSLDRSEAGVVTPRSIAVARADLSDTGGTTGAALGATDAGAVDLDAGSFSGVDDADVAAATPATPSPGTVTLTAAAVTTTLAQEDELRYSIDIGTAAPIVVTISLDDANGQVATDGEATATEIADALQAGLNAAGVLPDGVTVSRTGDVLTISNNSLTPMTVTVTDNVFDASGPTTTAIANGAEGNIAVATTDTGALGGTANADVENLRAAIPALSTPGTQTLTLQTGTIDTGTLYRLSIDGSTIEYRTIEGDDANSVAERLRDRATAIAPADFELSVVDNIITFTNNTANVINVEAQVNSGTAGGSLEDLRNISVLTSDAANSALLDIEVMIESAIDAASAFGSAQNRIDIQSTFIDRLVASLEAGVSGLTDANLEEASARLQALQVQQQLNIQALSIANAAPQALLALFQ